MLHEFRTAEQLVSHERLLELLSYDPWTGDFHWKVDQGKAKAGEKAGSKKWEKHPKRYYWMIGIDGQVYRAGRLAWFYVYGEWPHVLNHKNGQPLENGLRNLENGTHLDNMRNPVTRARISHGRRYGSRAATDPAKPTVANGGYHANELRGNSKQACKFVQAT